MCGICGVISLNKKVLNNATQVVKTMNKTILHRGPDGIGVHNGGNYCFGHTRLSIVDLSEAGHQPMTYNNRYTITYNGEVYNYIELRRKLEAEGYSFRSNTDTEVIMASYDYWGIDCVKKFNGMWAFVIYDRQKGKFFISKDRFGIKPLYYIKNENLFIFGSEIKAILAHPEINSEPNIEHLNSYIEDGPNEYGEITSFKRILRFPFAHSFEGTAEDLSSNFLPKRYWFIKPNLSKEKFSKSKAREYAKEYYDLLSDAVRLRLRADVKVGSALSGGLDSSSIVYLVNQQLHVNGQTELQNTFSTVYKSEGVTHCDESSYIDLLASKLNVKSWQIEPKINDIEGEHKKMILALENPPESSCMSAWHTFLEVSRRDVRVTLDGQGADEQLAGYVHYIRGHLLSLSLWDFTKEMVGFFKQPSFRGELLRSAILRLLLLIIGEKLFLNTFTKMRGWRLSLDLNETLNKSFETSLVTLLHYADHTSMAHSVESRMPFMDFRLVEFLSSVPSCYKIHNGWTKYIARLAFDGKLPNEVVWRKDKMGWPTPDDIWFRGGLNAWLNETLLSSKILKILKCKISFKSDFRYNTPVLKLVRLLNVAVCEKIFWLNKNSKQ